MDGLVPGNAFSQFESMKTTRRQVQAEDPLASFDSQLAGAIALEELQLVQELLARRNCLAVVRHDEISNLQAALCGDRPCGNSLDADPDGKRPALGIQQHAPRFPPM